MPQPITQLTSHLWVTQSRSLIMNSGVFISEGQACLIDPGLYPEEMDDLARFVNERGVRPRWLVLTHSHWDHILGPERFPGVTTIAHANYLAEVEQFDAGIRREISRWEQQSSVKREMPFVIPRPDETFMIETTVIVGALTLRLTHVPGHAADQLAVYHAESGALWASDILSDAEIPFVSDNLSAYERTLAMLARWDIRALVPGHGSAATEKGEIQRRLAEDRAYLSELRARIERAIREGKSVDKPCTPSKSSNRVTIASPSNTARGPAACESRSAPGTPRSCSKNCRRVRKCSSSAAARASPRRGNWPRSSKSPGWISRPGRLCWQGGASRQPDSFGPT